MCYLFCLGNYRSHGGVGDETERPVYNLLMQLPSQGQSLLEDERQRG